MQPTLCLRRKGFWTRSLDEFKRLSRIALTAEAIKGPQGPKPLFSFHEPDSIEECKAMSDADIGGFSQSHLEWVSGVAAATTIVPPVTSSNDPTTQQQQPTRQPIGYARFHGNISTRLPETRPDIQRSGYAGWRTLDRPRTVFGKSLWDIDSFAYLAVRVRSDGRAYFINLQTESLVPTDLHQHRLFCRRPGTWETVLVKWNDFVRTNHGFVVEPQRELLRQKVKSVGFGLTDRVPGPFELCIERVWATNDESEAYEGKEAPRRECGLRNKKGEGIRWGVV